MPKHQVKVRDIVLIDCNTPRSTCPIVIEIFHDKHGMLRVVKVLSRGLVSIRTVDKLLPLEISDVTYREERSKEPRTRRMTAIQARVKWNNLDLGVGVEDKCK